MNIFARHCESNAKPCLLANRDVWQKFELTFTAHIYGKKTYDVQINRLYLQHLVNLPPTGFVNEGLQTLH